MTRSMLQFIVAAFAVASSYALLTAAPTTTQEIHNMLAVEDPRPVAKAMVILEARYHQPITYEEGPYVFHDDVNEIGANGPRRILTPKGGRVDSDIQLPPKATKGQLVSLITQFLHAATESRGLTSDNFRVLQSNYGLHVVPTRVRDREGADTPVTPLLDVRITLPTQRADLYSILRSFCDVVSAATDAKIVLATIPRDFARRASMVAAEKERARDVLIRLLEEQGLLLSWHLLYGPTDNAFFLNIGQPGSLIPLK